MTDDPSLRPLASLLERPPRVINLGLKSFAHELQAQGVVVRQLDWAPPASGDADLAALLAKLGG